MIAQLSVKNAEGSGRGLISVFALRAGENMQ
jgi:hypothetical protein